MVRLHTTRCSFAINLVALIINISTMARGHSWFPHTCHTWSRDGQVFSGGRGPCCGRNKFFSGSPPQTGSLQRLQQPSYACVVSLVNRMFNENNTNTNILLHPPSPPDPSLLIEREREKIALLCAPNSWVKRQWPRMPSLARAILMHVLQYQGGLLAPGEPSHHQKRN